MQHDVANYMVGKGVAYFRKYAATPTNWAVTTAYAAGTYVNNGAYLWTTASGGTSSTGACPTGSTGASAGCEQQGEQFGIGKIGERWMHVDLLQFGRVRFERLGDRPVATRGVNLARTQP